MKLAGHTKLVADSLSIECATDKAQRVAGEGNKHKFSDFKNLKGTPAN